VAPGWVRRAATRAAALYDGSLPVADLVHDSLIDDPDAPTTGPRRLVFRSGDRSVQLTAHPSDDGASYAIAIDPPRAVDVKLRQGDNVTRVRTDSAGRAVVSAAGGELGTFVVDWSEADGGRVGTAWLCL
jgi:hypothetical protein